MEIQQKKDRYKGVLFCIIAAFLWSTGGILIKQVSWNPIAISGTRSFVAALVILAYIKKPNIIKSKATIYGSISCAGTVLFFIIANKLTTSANAILLQYTAPIFVAILGAIILREKIHWYDTFAIIAVSLGMVLFFVQNISPGNTMGNVIAIFTGISLAGVTIAIKLQGAESAIEITLFGNILAFLISIPFIFQSVPDMKSVFFIIILGVFQLGIPYIFFVNAIKYVSALEAILITIIEPLLNPLWVYIFTGESPGIYAILGGFIVITAVVLRGLYISNMSRKELVHLL